MTISADEKEEIERLVLSNGFSARQVNDYSDTWNRKWPSSSVYRMVRQIQVRGYSHRKKGSGRVPTKQNDPKIVEEVIQRYYPDGDKEKEGTRKIAKSMGISRDTVQIIIRNEKDKADKNGFLFE